MPALWESLRRPIALFPEPGVRPLAPLPTIFLWWELPEPDGSAMWLPHPKPSRGPAFGRRSRPTRRPVTSGVACRSIAPRAAHTRRRASPDGHLCRVVTEHEGCARRSASPIPRRSDEVKEHDVPSSRMTRSGGRFPERPAGCFTPGADDPAMPVEPFTPKQRAARSRISSTTACSPNAGADSFRSARLASNSLRRLYPLGRKKSPSARTFVRGDQLSHINDATTQRSLHASLVVPPYPPGPLTAKTNRKFSPDQARRDDPPGL